MVRLSNRAFNSLVAVGSFVVFFGGISLLTGSPIALVSYHLAELDSEAQGEIVLSEIKHTRRGGSVPFVRYVFVAGDQAYRSHIVSYRSVGEEEARVVVARYPVGKTVTVYYDSGAPYFSVLEPGPLDWSIYGQLACGVILATLTAAAFRRR